MPRRRPAILVLFALLGAACAGEGGADPAPAPDPRAGEAVRAVTLAFASIESCLHGSRDELPPSIDPESVRIRVLARGARAAAARLSECELSSGAAAVAALDGLEGGTPRRSAAVGHRMAEAAREAGSALRAFIASVLEYTEVRLAGDDRPELVREQARLNDDFHEALERLEEDLQRHIELESLIAG